MSNMIKKIKYKVMDFMSHIRIYKGGFILFGDSHYKIKAQHIRQIIPVLKSGDILLRRDDHYLGSLIIPGYWSHVALYVGNKNVIQMATTGIDIEDILSFLMYADNIQVLRLKEDDQELVNYAIDRAFKYLSLDVEYDYDFSFNSDDEMSCTELVDNCYKYPTMYDQKNKNYIVPDDFLNSIFKTVWSK